MNRTVILIDDDTDDLDFMQDSLVEVDGSIQCVPFERPEPAIELFAKDRLPVPDFIFMDMNMPGMGGEKSLLKLRTIDRLRDTPIIMVSTSMPAAQGNTLISEGATFTFQKPWRLRDYRRIIKKILSGRLKSPQHIFNKGGIGN